MLNSSCLTIFLVLYLRVCQSNSGGILYPRESESREVVKLDGIWEFRADFGGGEDGFKQVWFKSPLSKV